MTHAQFVTKYLGRFVDFDGNKKYWCVDAMRQYTKDVFNLSGWTIPAGATAKAIFYNFKDNASFKKVLNTPTNMPKKGDFVFFKTSILPPWNYGMAGHVAIVDSATLYSMIVIEQNFPTGSAVRMRKTTYKDTLGWITRK